MRQSKTAPVASIIRIASVFWILGLLSSATAFAQLNDAQLAQRRSEGIVGRFTGSYLGLSTNLGSGTLIRSEFSDNPYLSEELLLYPRFKLGENLDLRARWSLECELTQPDGPNGKHCPPSDLRLSLHHTKLWSDPWIGGRLSGSFQVWLPTSEESRFNHTVMNLRLATGYDVTLLRERLELSYGFAVQKYFPTQRVRGFHAGDGTSVEGQGIPLYNLRSSAGADGSVGSGGTMNDNLLFINSVHAAWYFTPRLSLAVDLLVMNYLRFAVGSSFSDPSLPSVGQSDWTWGTIEAAYQPRDHLVLAIGITSLQPALAADGKSLRFPFYDFVSPANNFTKWYLSATVLF